MHAFVSVADYPLAVVTVVADDGELSGCLVGFFTQCSIEPSRFLVCLSKVNHTYVVSRRAAGMCLHLMGEDQVPVASLFGEQTGDMTDKFSRCRWHRGVTGAPVLEQCAAWVEGTVLDRYDVGDHEAVLMTPVSGGSGDGAGLLTLHHSPEFHPGHPAEQP
jgi:flavin reductase (DIM6/NTAB) family NADH-FMN oxidoreductase RutF